MKYKININGTNASNNFLHPTNQWDLSNIFSQINPQLNSNIDSFNIEPMASNQIPEFDVRINPEFEAIESPFSGTLDEVSSVYMQSILPLKQPQPTLEALNEILADKNVKEHKIATLDIDLAMFVGDPSVTEVRNIKDESFITYPGKWVVSALRRNSANKDLSLSSELASDSTQSNLVYEIVHSDFYGKPVFYSFRTPLTIIDRTIIIADTKLLINQTNKFKQFPGKSLVHKFPHKLVFLDCDNGNFEIFAYTDKENLDTEEIIHNVCFYIPIKF